MSRNGVGVYSYPAGTRGNPNTIIESAKYNSFIDDLAETLNSPTPITAGGTGASTAAQARINLGIFGTGGVDKALSEYRSEGFTDQQTLEAFLNDVAATGGRGVIDEELSLTAKVTVTSGAYFQLDGFKPLVWEATAASAGIRIIIGNGVAAPDIFDGFEMRTGTAIVDDALTLDNYLNISSNFKDLPNYGVASVLKVTNISNMTITGSSGITTSGWLNGITVNCMPNCYISHNRFQGMRSSEGIALSNRHINSISRDYDSRDITAFTVTKGVINVTHTGNAMQEGGYIHILEIPGELGQVLNNRTFKVENVSGNSFDLAKIEGFGLPPWTSGGKFEGSPAFPTIYVYANKGTWADNAIYCTQSEGVFLEANNFIGSRIGFQCDEQLSAQLWGENHFNANFAGVSIRGTAGVNINQLLAFTFRNAFTLKINSITKANPGVVTYSGEKPVVFQEHERVKFTLQTEEGVAVGMTQLNDLSFEIANLNTTAKTFNLRKIEESAVVTNITQANPAVVTYDGAYTFVNGMKVYIRGVSGMVEVNETEYTVANVNLTAKTFELSGVNSTGYTAYDSRGVIKPRNLLDTTGYATATIAITGITRGATTVISHAAPAVPFGNYMYVTITGVAGTTEVNDRTFTIANVNSGANTFEIGSGAEDRFTPLNSTSFAAYVSGGVIFPGTCAVVGQNVTLEDCADFVVGTNRFSTPGDNISQPITLINCRKGGVVGTSRFAGGLANNVIRAEGDTDRLTIDHQSIQPGAAKGKFEDNSSGLRKHVYLTGTTISDDKPVISDIYISPNNAGSYFGGEDVTAKLVYPGALVYAGIQGQAHGKRVAAWNATSPASASAGMFVLQHESGTTTRKMSFNDRHARFLLPGDSIPFVYDTMLDLWHPDSNVVWTHGLDFFDDMFTAGMQEQGVGGTGTVATTALGSGSEGQKPFGIVRLSSGTGATDSASYGVFTNSLRLGYGSAFAIIRAAPDTLSSAAQEYKVRLGFFDSPAGTANVTDGVYWEYAGGSRAITGITQANPAVVTYSGSDIYQNGDKVRITGVVGMTQVNNLTFTVANVNTGANTFELLGINSTGYTAYSSAGTLDSPNWQLCTSSGGTHTKTYSTVSASVAFQEFVVFVNGDGTRADFLFSGDGAAWTVIGSHTTNIPTGANFTGFGAAIHKTVGTTARFLDIDYSGFSISHVRGS